MQNLSCIHFAYIPLVPIFLFWNLRIQDRLVLADVLALFLPNFQKLIGSPSALGAVKNIKANAVSLAPGLCYNAVLPFCFGLDADIVLCNPPQHICALANVNNIAVNLDTVNSGVFILLRKPFALHPVIGVVCIGSH